MDAPTYDVYLTGKLAEGLSADAAAERLAQLFKTSPQSMAALLTGKAQVLKRGVDRPTALKYRDALARAGVEVAFKTQAAAPAAAPPAAAARATTAAPVAAAPAPAQAIPAPASTGLSLAPAGTDVLKEDERRVIAAVAVDTSHLSVAPPGDLSSGIERPPTAAPDTSHLSVAAAGADLLSASERERPPAAVPDTEGLTLAAAGSPLETLRRDIEPINPDISGLALAPVGSDLLTEEQRRRPAPPAPNTDHLRVLESDR